MVSKNMKVTLLTFAGLLLLLVLLSSFGGSIRPTEPFYEEAQDITPVPSQPSEEEKKKTLGAPASEAAPIVSEEAGIPSAPGAAGADGAVPGAPGAPGDATPSMPEEDVMEGVPEPFENGDAHSAVF